MVKRRHIETTPVDSGFSWVVLIATSIIYLILVSTSKSFVILYAEFLLFFGTGSGNTAWIGSVNAFLYFGLGPISNRLAEIFSFRAVVLCGGITYSLGFLLSSFVQRMEVLYLTYGIISGIGGGLVFAPTNTILNFYFEKKRALANGIMISAGGVGSFLVPYLYRYLIDVFGLRGALLILSGIITNVCVGAAVFRQPSQLVLKFQKSDEYKTLLVQKNSSRETHFTKIENEIKNSQQDDRIIEHEQTDGNVNDTANKKNLLSIRKVLSFSNWIDFSLFRNPSFSIYVLAFTSHTMAYLANCNAIVQKILELGFSKDRVSIVLSIAGLSEIFSKLFFGWIMDLKLFKVKYFLLLIFLGAGITTISIPFFTSFIVFGVYAGILGAFPGSFIIFIAVSLLQYIQLTDLTRGFGLTTMFMSFGAVLSMPIGGWIEDATGSWDYSLWYAASLYIFSASLLLGEPFFNRYWCFRSKRTNDDNQEKFNRE